MTKVQTMEEAVLTRVRRLQTRQGEYIEATLADPYNEGLTDLVRRTTYEILELTGYITRNQAQTTTREVA